MSIKSLLLAILLWSNSILIYAQSAWEVVKNKDNIIVYTRNEQGSAFKSFKAVVLLEDSPQKIIKVLKNADDYHKWYGFTKTSKVLALENDTQYNYVETIFPWPYSNRDMVYKMTITYPCPKEVLILLEGLSDYMPEKEDIHRMSKAKGFIKLKIVEKHTALTYQFHSEPGDNIPAWLANNSIAELPFSTLKGLREILLEN